MGERRRPVRNGEWVLSRRDFLRLSGGGLAYAALLGGAFPAAARQREALWGP
ncbi:hypothetical protein Rxycam_00769 [Rubrobacter xylanophilus DSM 9941]|uniref:twin-arginine translocation signal domain-containing protein n=1 Tax=Rubrobacter xylanophilus TaxID=49319 RepID=UPI001C640E66|nr:twin-arginine translocation signal domain-containing protein [Rubrobacter xylanophilus]QYJ14958.1 hypothetical protein Rxycam_00769 [Rubrobacter xylanophilus DSM 9941]